MSESNNIVLRVNMARMKDEGWIYIPERSLCSSFKVKSEGEGGKNISAFLSFTE